MAIPVQGFEYDYWPVTMNWLGLGQRIHLEEDAGYAEQVKEALDFAIRKQNEKVTLILYILWHWLDVI